MISTQTKIQKHKEHIQKRIHELQNRLRSPKNSTEIGKQNHQNEDLPYRRILVQKQNYVEPEQIKVLRERETNARESRRARGRESRRVYGQLQPQNVQKMKMQPRDKLTNNVQLQKSMGRSLQRQNLGEPYNMNNVQIHHPKGIPIVNYKQNTEPKERSQLYDLMTQILTNQKNLEKEIVLLRSEWSRQQNTRGKQKQSSLTPYQKINRPQKQMVSFQDTEPIKKAQIKQQSGNSNKLSNNQQYKVKQKQKQKRSMSSRVKKQTKVRDFEQEPTFGMDPHQILGQQSLCQQQDFENKDLTKGSHKITKSGKKVRYEQAAQQKLVNLLKNQRCKNERLVVTDLNKNEFWVELEHRIKSSEYEFRQSGHRNNRHQNQHLINTNQLQKKLREDVISKIYSQVNNCIYK